MNRDFITERKNEEEIEEAKRKQRKAVRIKTLCVLWLVSGLGCLFGGMFSGLNWLVLTGLILLFGGAIALSVAVLAMGYVKNAKKQLEKYGGSKKPYIYKGVFLGITITAAIVFGVCGFVIDFLFCIGAVVCFLAFILAFFGWQP